MKLCQVVRMRYCHRSQGEGREEDVVEAGVVVVEEVGAEAGVEEAEGEEGNESKK